MCSALADSEKKPSSRLIATDFRIAPVLAELRRLAGTDQDILVAKRLGILPKDVATFRKRHGVPAFEGRANWKEVDDLLGLILDRDVAQRFGLDTSTVRKRRHKLGIEPYRRNEPVLTGKCDRALQLPLSDEKAAEWLGVQVRVIRYRRAWLKKTYGDE